jgi:hypothetical protein
MRGRAEHQGNRNYFGQERINAAPKSRIYQQLVRIAQLRARTPALQKGLMLPLQFKGDQAAFYRVYQKGGQHQIALVLLNKGDAPASFDITDYVQPGTWKATLGGESIKVADGAALHATVGAHDVQVYLLDAAATRADLVIQLTRLMNEKGHPGA